MKKKYMQPLSEEANMNEEQMICVSIDDVAGIDGVDIGKGDFPGGSVDEKNWDEFDEFADDLW